MTAAPESRGGSQATSQGAPPRTTRARERAAPTAVPTLRHAASEFAVAHGARNELVERIALAVSEAVTNAVKYAYGATGEGTVELTASLAGEWIEIVISDEGGGFRAGGSSGLGIGLSLVAQMSGDLRIEQSRRGTKVTMRFPLSADGASGPSA